MISSDTGTLVKSVKAFRERGKTLRIYAVVIIVLIVFVLFAGIAIFYYAGQLANTEANQAVTKEKQTRLSGLRDDLNQMNRRLSDAKTTLARLEQQLTAERAGVGGTKVAGVGPVVFLLISQIADQKAEISGLEQEKDRLERDIAKIETEFADGAMQMAITNQDRLWRVVSAGITRLGAVIMLLFLVKILTPLYRYNMKLSYYFDARADALELLATDDEEQRDVATFDRLVLALTPSGIDFGPSPQSPSEEALEWTKQVLNSKLGK